MFNPPPMVAYWNHLFENKPEMCPFFKCQHSAVTLKYRPLQNRWDVSEPSYEEI